MKKILKLLFFFLGIIILMFTISSSVFNVYVCLFMHSDIGNHNQVPIDAYEGIVVDSKCNIFIGIPHYGRIQKYDSKGKFIKGWPSRTFQGSLRMAITSDDNLEVTGPRGDAKITFDNDGDIIKKIDDTECTFFEAMKRKNNNVFFSNDGTIYKIVRECIPYVEKSGNERRKIMLESSLFCKILSYTRCSPWIVLIAIFFFLISDFEFCKKVFFGCLSFGDDFNSTFFKELVEEDDTKPMENLLKRIGKHRE